MTRIRRTRYTGDEPLALLTNYLPRDLIDLGVDDLTRHGLYELLRGSGVNLRVANQSIGARAATSAEARRLDERRGVPVLTMTRTAFDDKGARSSTAATSTGPTATPTRSRSSNAEPAGPAAS
ncbi:UTRA domain-containing protein [Actinomadura yumaensis]|uniref:UTRA domain-containing protein n=1 Tax=Actinomadura yumaensis TaxID=111807 RepID=UPI003616C957